MSPKKHESVVGAATKWALRILTLSMLVLPERTMAAGTWTALANAAPSTVGHMLLLPDGTVMAHEMSTSTHWYRLKPDSRGSYVNGTWSVQASMNYQRLYYSSAVLRDGRVFVIGGEYSNEAGGSPGEVYDPQSDTWTVIQQIPSALWNTGPSGDGFSDSPCEVLPNGNILIAPVHYHVSDGTLIYNPSSDSWSAGGNASDWQAEASWVKLPDDSILTADPDTTFSERYIPSLNAWVDDGDVPVSLYASLPCYVGEIGPAFLLGNGHAIIFGGTGHTALYTPTGTTNSGTWVAGPDVPNGLVTADAAGAMMVNGKILCGVTPPPTDTSCSIAFYGPTTFVEYDPIANSITRINGPPSSDTNAVGYLSRMLDLPNGTVLWSSGASSQIYAYQPDGSPLVAGKPAITSITANADGSFHLTGMGLNGISEGASYGDDDFMGSNYPLVRMTDGSGNVYYGRTYNWSSTGVMTGSKPVTTEFALPTTIYQGGPSTYLLVVVANGISSDPITFYGPVWVDFNWNGSQAGTYLNPYKTLAQGVAAVPVGGTLFIKGNASSAVAPTMNKAMTIVAIGGPVTVGR